MNSHIETTFIAKLSRVALTLSIVLAAVLPSNVRAEADKGGLTILITGANRGLGLEHAKQFSEAGYEVIGTARKPEEAAKLKATGAKVMKLDITSDQDIAELAKALDGKRIDILLNNAGYMNRGLDREALRRCFDVNASGPLLLTEALLPNLKLSKQPKIINVSSRLGRISKTSGYYTAYSMSKAALNMATRQLHEQLSKEGFIVISLGPGHNQTDMGGKNAALKPEDSVKKMVKLISGLEPSQSGRFWYHDGTELPW